MRELGIEVRAGLHTGECEIRDDDVAGMAVNIGARIGALARPGEVLVSSTVKDLVVGSGLEFEPRGAHDAEGRTRRVERVRGDRAVGLSCRSLSAARGSRASTARARRARG